ncbi:acyl-homoserine-lactone synthase [Frigidibacter sp. SD6-1]|uniref:acyl-homoserine-lactone synthase n=1 Tax=Frigidibacter sp. SD6-1 TaxID=3032581 RepID=UPI0024DFCBAE|nr:acyl-homoserine-lactone synthase [Frigidibacter sp. SD6-1]
MYNITFDLSDMYQYGSAFYDYLKLRKQYFVDTLHWDIPHNDAVEMDQYDNPLAHYSLVMKDGKVVGGARAMPTTSRWGEHTYMIRDAVAGKLPGIPTGLLQNGMVTPQVWECTRLITADSVDNHADRGRVLSLVMQGVSDIARRHGASELIAIAPVLLVRAMRQLGWPVNRISEPYYGKEDGRCYAVLQMPVEDMRIAAE